MVYNVTAQTEQCFKNEGLKQVHTVRFTISGNKIKGTFVVSAYEEPTATKTVEFTGTRSGNLLTIGFRGKVPYELPPGPKKIVWTLGKTTLKITIYGKNYKTNKFSTYTATFEKCGK